jgi:hypothetical protein
LHFSGFLVYNSTIDFAGGAMHYSFGGQVNKGDEIVLLRLAPDWFGFVRRNKKSTSAVEVVAVVLGAILNLSNIPRRVQERLGIPAQAMADVIEVHEGYVRLQLERNEVNLHELGRGIRAVVINDGDPFGRKNHIETEVSVVSDDVEAN